MSRWRKKPVEVEASQWHKNGDHPEDFAGQREGLEGGELRTWTGEQARELGWEGAVVRYFRHPDVPGEQACRHCGQTMHVHGWIETLEGGHIVCPGDWIITGVAGERYPCKPAIFDATYVAAEPAEPDSDTLVPIEGTEAIDLLGEIAQRLGVDSDEEAVLDEIDALVLLREVRA